MRPVDATRGSASAAAATGAEAMTAPARDDLGGRLSLLAQSVSGSAVRVCVDDVEAAWTDGEVIHVPEGAPLRETVVAQSLLIAAGSLGAGMGAGLAWRDAVRRRFVALEVARGAAVVGCAVPRRTAALITEVCCEPLTSSGAESASLAASARSLPLAPAWMGTIRPSLLRRGGHGARVGADRAEDRDSDLEEQGDGDEPTTKPLASGTGSRSLLARMLQSAFGSGRSSSDGAGDESGVGTRAARVDARGVVTRLAGTLRDAISEVPAHGVAYPEWDEHAQHYRPDWCLVAEYEPAVDGTKHAIAPSDLQLQRRLARLGVAHERHRHRLDGDGLDLTALVDYSALRVAGDAGDPRVYERQLRTRHDLGVLLLVDATGSTAEGYAGREVFAEQQRIAGRLMRAFEAVGDRVAVHAFTAQGRQNVRYLRVKTFDDRLDRRAEDRLAALEPSGFTRLGAAVRHSTRLLLDGAGTSKLLLLTIGDGLPYDQGYEDRYAQEDSRRALSEAVERGVACACLSVASSTDQAVVDRVWGHVPHVHLDEAADLAGEITTLVQRALRVAALVQKAPDHRAKERRLAANSERTAA